MISSDTIKCHPDFIVIGSRQFQSIVSWFPYTLLYRQHYLHFFRWRLTTCFLFFFVITKWRETKTWLTYKKCTTTERRGESRTVQGSDDAGLVSPPPFPLYSISLWRKSGITKLVIENGRQSEAISRYCHKESSASFISLQVNNVIIT